MTDDLHDALTRWIDSLHEDANGIVWTTKAELRAALAARGVVLLREALDWDEWQFAIDLLEAHNAAKTADALRAALAADPPALDVTWLRLEHNDPSRSPDYINGWNAAIARVARLTREEGT